MMGNSNKPLRSPLHPRDIAYMKPEGFEHYMTIGEVSRSVGRDISWIKRLERDDRIPKSKRVKVGLLHVRLWSPKQVEEIQVITSSFKRGRPSGGKIST